MSKAYLFWCLSIAFIVCSLTEITAPVYSLAQATQMPGMKVDVDMGAMVRSAYVHLPIKYDAGNKYPLVMVFHGGGQDPAKIAEISNFNNQADKGGFIVVYPEGINHRWNDGRKISGQDESLLADDISFVKKLDDVIGQRWLIDPKRTYAVGFSNGGIFCQRLGFELSDIFSAISAISASMSEEQFKSARASQPVSVVMLFGKDDPIEPLNGGEVKFAGSTLGRIASVQDVVKLWVQKDGCLTKPVQEDVSNDKTTKIISEHYPSTQAAGAEVLFYLIEGGGHTWPGTQWTAPEATYGKTSQNISATELTWEFFKHHPRS